jgi:hypothetical protein
MSPAANLPQQQLQEARDKTEQVQQQLEVASAELGLTHGALERHLPVADRCNDVAWAIAQNAVLERKVQHAAEELEQVTEMLERATAAASA